MRSGLPNIIEKVRISEDFESPETDLHIAVNASGPESGDTKLSA